MFSEDLVYLHFTYKGAQSDLGGISRPTLQEYVLFLTATLLCSFSDHMFGLFSRVKLSPNTWQLELFLDSSEKIDVDTLLSLCLEN